MVESFTQLNEQDEETSRRGTNSQLVLSRKSNPEPAAADMYESFHGRPSEQIVTFEEDEHYHEYLSELGVCCGLLVEKEDGKCVALGLSGYMWQGKGKDAGFVEGSESRENPRRSKFGANTKRLTLRHDVLFFSDRDQGSRNLKKGEKVPVTWSQGIGMGTAYYHESGRTFSKALYAKDGRELFKNWPEEWKDWDGEQG